MAHTNKENFLNREWVKLPCELLEFFTNEDISKATKGYAIELLSKAYNNENEPPDFDSVDLTERIFFKHVIEKALPFIAINNQEWAQNQTNNSSAQHKRWACKKVRELLKDEYTNETEIFIDYLSMECNYSNSDIVKAYETQLSKGEISNDSILLYLENLNQ